MLFLQFLLPPLLPPLAPPFSFQTTTMGATSQRFLEPAPIRIRVRGRAVASAFDGVIRFAREKEFGEFGEGEVGG